MTRTVNGTGHSRSPRSDEHLFKTIRAHLAAKLPFTILNGATQRVVGKGRDEQRVPLTVRGTQALVSFAPLAFKPFCAARQNAVLRRSPFPPP